MLNCPKCGKPFKMEIGYTGADWNCEAGERSGYGYELSLECSGDCPEVYIIGHLKNESDISPVIDKYKVVKNQFDK